MGAGHEEEAWVREHHDKLTPFEVWPPAVKMAPWKEELGLIPREHAVRKRLGWIPDVH